MSELRFVKGYKYGAFTFLRPVKNSKTSWHVQCDCGALSKISLASIYEGRKRACKACQEVVGTEVHRVNPSRVYKVKGAFINHILSAMTPKTRREVYPLLRENVVEWGQGS